MGVAHGLQGAQPVGGLHEGVDDVGRVGVLLREVEVAAEAPDDVVVEDAEAVLRGQQVAHAGAVVAVELAAAGGERLALLLGVPAQRVGEFGEFLDGVVEDGPPARLVLPPGPVPQGVGPPAVPVVLFGPGLPYVRVAPAGRYEAAGAALDPGHLGADRWT